MNRYEQYATNMDRPTMHGNLNSYALYCNFDSMPLVPNGIADQSGSKMYRPKK